MLNAGDKSNEVYVPFQIIFRLSESFVQALSDGSPAPTEYKLTLLKEEQSRAVLSETLKPGN